MRVAYVSTDPGIPVFGRKGASVHVQAVLRVLVRAGAEVHLVCSSTGGEVPADLAGVQVHRLPRVSGEPGAPREAAAVASDRAVTDVLDALAHERPLDLVYERYALWGRSATAWARDRGVPSLLEVNAPLVEEQQRHRLLVDRAGAEAAARAAFGQARSVIAVSAEVARWVRASAGSDVRVEVVPNGVDTTRVTPASRPVAPVDAERFTVGFAGTLKPWHGVETLIEAVALLVGEDPSYHLLLVGDGPQAPALHEQAERLGIGDRVEMTGSVAPDEMPDQLRRMDLATAPYPATDGFYFSPLKVYEYLAAGLPVVASAVGPLPGLLDHGRLGTLVPAGDATALAAAVAALRADHGRRTEIRRAAPTLARSHDWTHVVRCSLDTVGLALPGVARVA